MAIYNSAALLLFGCGRLLDFKIERSGAFGALYITLGVFWVVCIIVMLLSFNLATLYFGFHYYKCSSEIKFLAKNRTDLRMLEQKKRNNDLIYYTLFFLNFISCIAFGLIYFNEALQKEIFGNPSPNTKLEIGARLMVGLLQAISFIFLTIGTVRIRNHLVNGTMRNSINEKMIWLHGLSFFFYIMASIGFYIALFNYYLAP
jgi:hypothetical protein